MTDEITPEAPDLPHTLQIEVTSRCNLKCTMCALTRGQTLSGQQPGHMSQAVWERVRDQAIRTGEVIISGYGEPFTHPGYLAMLRELDETGVRFGMSTNGILLTPTIAGQLAQFKHLVHVNVSIDSPDPTTYRKIRGCDLDRALAGLHALRSTLRESHRITVSSVLTPETIHSLIGFPRLLAKYGVRRYKPHWHVLGEQSAIRWCRYIPFSGSTCVLNSVRKPSISRGRTNLATEYEIPALSESNTRESNHTPGIRGRPSYLAFGARDRPSHTTFRTRWLGSTDGAPADRPLAALDLGSTHIFHVPS